MTSRSVNSTPYCTWARAVLPSGLSWVVGSVTDSTSRQLAHLGDDRGDHGCSPAVEDAAVVGVEHQLGRRARRRGEALLQEVRGLLGLDPGDTEGVGVLTADPAGEDTEADQGGEPEEKDPAAVGDAPAAETVEGEGHPPSVTVTVKSH